jgi:outer membrane protein TolC
MSIHIVVMRTLLGTILVLSALVVRGAVAPTNPAPAGATGGVSRLLLPLSLAEALDVALQQNSAIRKSAANLEATYGVIVQTRAIALPRVTIGSAYSANAEGATDELKAEGVPGDDPLLTRAFVYANQRWSSDIRVTQSIYEGGRINSSLRSARLTRDAALLNHETVIANALRDVRVAYYDTLLAQELIAVQEASLKLLERELSETTKRLRAGTVPQFNVLRAEVEVANARPKLIRAKNAFRKGKDRLATLLGEKIPTGTDELALQLTDKLQVPAWQVDLTNAVALAFAQRTELMALRKSRQLRDEDVVSAKSGYKPSVQIFAGYGAQSSQFSRDLTEEVHGWEAGAQLQWNIFDGFLTKGRVREAEGLRLRSSEELAEAERDVELEVRTAYSSFIEAREVLVSQEKVQESAEESLRLASAREAAGAATQLDVLDAQTALTDARSTKAVAWHEYAVARARLERAVGQKIEQTHR